jgi:hypothetical protein
MMSSLLGKYKSINNFLKLNKKMNSSNFPKFSYISSFQAKDLDDELMSPEVGYVTEQLMEIAGQSVALCVDNIITEEWKANHKILTICGPGSKNIINQ